MEPRRRGTAKRSRSYSNQDLKPAPNNPKAMGVLTVGVPDAERARILCELENPPKTLPANATSPLAAAALILRDLLHDFKIESIPLFMGTNGIALWIPVSGAPTFPAVRSWLHEVCNEAVRRHPQQ